MMMIVMTTSKYDNLMFAPFSTRKGASVYMCFFFQDAFLDVQHTALDLIFLFPLCVCMYVCGYNERR